MKTDAVTRHFIEYNAQIKIRFCPPIKNSFQLLPKGNIHFENRQQEECMYSKKHVIL